MDFDKAMLNRLGQNGIDQLWRIYSWSPAALSIGNNQKIDDVLKTEWLTKTGFEIVKRPTGGRAIYHKNDICISSAGFVPESTKISLPAKLIYNSFSEVLQLFFENLNIKTVLARGPRLNHLHRSGIGKLPCFLSATPHELLSESHKKLAGIALFVGKARYLVQASITVEPMLPEDFQFFRGIVDSQAALENVTSIVDESGRPYSQEEIRLALLKALAQDDVFCVENISEALIVKKNCN